MGFHQRIFDQLNELSKRYTQDGLPDEFEFSSDDPLDVAGRKLMHAGQADGADFPEGVIELLAAWPDVLADVLMRVARTGFKNQRQVRWAWKPAYDFELNITQARTGEVTVVVSSPYPDELRPFRPTAG